MLKTDWKSCIKLGTTVFLVYLCIFYWDTVAKFAGTLAGAASPLLIGATIAYIVNILMCFFERHYFPNSKKVFVEKTRRPVCVLIAFITLVAIIALVVVLVAPQLTQCIQLIITILPGAMKSFIAWLDEFSFISEEIINLLSSIDWRSWIDKFINMVASGIGNTMTIVLSTVTAVFSGIVTAFLSVIFSIYLLCCKDILVRQVKRISEFFMSTKVFAKSSYTVTLINDCFRRYIIGQCTEAVILGILCTLGMLILRLPYATMIGALVAFTSLIPVVGAFFGAFVGAFMILTVSPVKALIFVIFILILQQLEGNLIYPKVVGTTVGLPSLWVLAAVTIGGGTFGIIGMLVAVPITAAIYHLLKNHIASSNRAAEEKEEELPASDEDTQ